MSKEHLSEFFDSVLKSDKNEEDMYEAFSKYIESKGKSILKELMEETKKPIRLKGDEVLVNGKKVGSVEHDEDDEKLTFKCDKDDKEHKFDSVKDLFAYLSKEHKLDESLAEEGDKGLKSKSEKDIKAQSNKKNGKQLKKETGFESKASKDEDTEDETVVNKRKNQARQRVDKFTKKGHDIDWHKD